MNNYKRATNCGTCELCPLCFILGRNFSSQSSFCLEGLAYLFMDNTFGNNSRQLSEELLCFWSEILELSLNILFICFWGSSYRQKSDLRRDILLFFAKNGGLVIMWKILNFLLCVTIKNLLKDAGIISR